MTCRDICPLSSPHYVEMSEALVLFLVGQSPEDEVLLPPGTEVGLAQSVAPADPPPPLRLVMADSEGLAPWRLLGLNIAGGDVVPPVTTGVHSPLDDMAPVCGGRPDTQLETQINTYGETRGT